MSQPRNRRVAGNLLAGLGVLASAVALLLSAGRDPNPLLVAGATLGLLLCVAAIALGWRRGPRPPSAPSGGTAAPLPMRFYAAGAMPNLSARLGVTHDLFVVGTGFVPAVFESPSRLERFLDRPESSLRVLLPAAEPEEARGRRVAELRSEYRVRRVLDQIADLRRPDVEIRAQPALTLSALVLDRSDVWLLVDVAGGRHLYAVSELEAGRRGAVLVDELEAQWAAALPVPAGTRGRG